MKKVCTAHGAVWFYRIFENSHIPTIKTKSELNLAS